MPLGGQPFKRFWASSASNCSSVAFCAGNPCSTQRSTVRTETPYCSATSVTRSNSSSVERIGFPFLSAGHYHKYDDVPPYLLKYTTRRHICQEDRVTRASGQ